MLNLNPVWTADTQQSHFRLLLDVMSRPGKCHTLLTSLEKKQSVLAVLATLLDAEVTLADPHDLLHTGDWPMLQANAALPEQADYVVCDGKRTPSFTPKLGSLSSPEQSATLILLVDALDHGDIRIKLSGPGINGVRELNIEGLDKQWLEKREDWIYAFPLGVDIILVDGNRVTALPRTTKVEAI